MSIIKWFSSLFSNKYSIVYDPARDGGTKLNVTFTGDICELKNMMCNE